MDELALQRLLDEVRSGACSPDDAVLRLRRLPFADLGFAKVDHHRHLRQQVIADVVADRAIDDIHKPPRQRRELVVAELPFAAVDQRLDQVER